MQLAADQEADQAEGEQVERPQGENIRLLHDPEAAFADQDTDYDIANHLGNAEFLESPCPEYASEYAQTDNG